MSSIIHIYEIESATIGEDRFNFNNQMKTIINFIKKILGRSFDSFSTSESLRIDLFKNEILLMHNDKIESSQFLAMESENVCNILRKILESASFSIQSGIKKERSALINGKKALEGLNIAIIDITFKEIHETCQWISQEGCWYCNNTQQKLRFELLLEFSNGDRASLDCALEGLIRDFVCAGVTPEVLDFVSNSFIREFVCAGFLPKSLICYKYGT